MSTFFKWLAVALVIIFLYTNVEKSQRYIEIGIIIILLGIMLKNDIGGQIKDIMDENRQKFSVGEIYRLN